jgi:hypothetical protein
VVKGTGSQAFEHVQHRVEFLRANARPLPVCGEWAPRADELPDTIAKQLSPKRVGHAVKPLTTSREAIGDDHDQEWTQISVSLNGARPSGDDQALECNQLRGTLGSRHPTPLPRGRSAREQSYAHRHPNPREHHERDLG